MRLGDVEAGRAGRDTGACAPSGNVTVDHGRLLVAHSPKRVGVSVDAARRAARGALQRNARRAATQSPECKAWPFAAIAPPSHAPGRLSRSESFDVAQTALAAPSSLAAAAVLGYRPASATVQLPPCVRYASCSSASRRSFSWHRLAVPGGPSAAAPPCWRTACPSSAPGPAPAATGSDPAELARRPGSATPSRIRELSTGAEGATSRTTTTASIGAHPTTTASADAAIWDALRGLQQSQGILAAQAERRRRSTGSSTPARRCSTGWRRSNARQCVDFLYGVTDRVHRGFHRRAPRARGDAGRP